LIEWATPRRSDGKGLYGGSTKSNCPSIDGKPMGKKVWGGGDRAEWNKKEKRRYQILQSGGGLGL